MNDYIGWEKPTAPTKLVQEGSVMTDGPGMAEAMMKQHEKKEREVQEALAEAKSEFMATGRILTVENKAVFNWRKVTQKEVEDKTAEEDTKELFGDDGIS